MAVAARSLETLQDLPDSFAIAVNDAFVPRSAYDNTTIIQFTCSACVHIKRLF